MGARPSPVWAHAPTRQSAHTRLTRHSIEAGFTQSPLKWVGTHLRRMGSSDANRSACVLVAGNKQSLLKAVVGPSWEPSFFLRLSCSTVQWRFVQVTHFPKVQPY